LRVVGVDDWAWQKGQQHFGTILVDLEELGRLRRFLVVPHRTPPHAIIKPAVTCQPGRHLRSTYVEQEDRLARERRATQLARFRLVKRLQAAGHNASAIMRETGLGRTYVRTWVRLDDLPERNRMEPRVGMAAFYREYLWSGAGPGDAAASGC
jgi:hypothetical protein